jgi:CDP-diglyceride synthetase
VSDDETGPRGLLDALEVRRNTLVGFAVGVVVTVAIFTFFVVLPGATTRSPLYYGALAFVLAVAVGGLATVLLLARQAYHLSRELQ